NADAKASANLFQSVEEHRLTLAVDIDALLQKLRVVEHVIIERPSIFGQAERGERALPFGKIDRVHGWVTDRHHRLFGIDVDGRNVEPKLRLGREKQKPADAMHLDTRGGTKADVNPVAVLPDTKAMFRAANLEDRFAWTGDGDDQRGFHMRALG